MEAYGNYNRAANGRCGCGANMGTRHPNNDFPSNRGRMERTKEMNEHKEIHDKMRMYERPVGIAYVPMQEFGEMYDACKGLKEGTMFPELNLIFCGIRGN